MKWQCRDKILEITDRPEVMGILNVTPDSFSDGGAYSDVGSAIEAGTGMYEDGAGIIDVGGESTRPGAAAVSEQEEIDRVIPVIEGLRKRTQAVISIDTMKSAVARYALAAGADIINDVSAFTHDSGMIEAAKDTGAGIVLMHMLGSPRTMQENPQYDNVVEEVSKYLRERVDVLVAEGILPGTLAVDPGIGFGKTVEHNLRLLAGLKTLTGQNMPVIVGLSRKSFLGKITGRNINERLAGSLAGLAFCVMNGVHVVRVHDVRASVDVIRVLKALSDTANAG